MSNRLLLIIIISHFGLFLWSQQIIVQPYLQNASPISMTIMWEVDNVGTGMVEWGLTPFDLNNSANSTSQVGNNNSRIHTVILPSLVSNQKYYYRVKMEDESNTMVYHFRTPAQADDEKSTQLVAISDMQRDGAHPNKYQEIINDGIITFVNSMISDDLSNLDAILIPGDLYHFYYKVSHKFLKLFQIR